MISVIMPIYNGEKYIRDSIKRILSQSFVDLELILIDDGSTDGSLKICEELKAKDNRIKLISKSNGGICAARNDGVKVAKGEWISFADQDDNICDGIYDLFSSAASPDVDMIIAGKRMLLVDTSNTVVSDKVYDYRKEKVSDKQTILHKIFNANGDSSLMHIWNCAYRRNTLLDNGVFFDERFKFGHEDTLFNSVFALKSRSITFTNGVVYEYYRRKSSSTSFKKNPNYIDDIENYFSVFYEAASSELKLQPKLESQIYTYFLRLSMSLFLEYSNSIKDMTEEEQLNLIYEICKHHTNSNKVDQLVSGGTIKYIYFSILSCFLSQKRYGVASRILDIRR